jgi:spermidine/putrescine transport system ATP-binding protein
MAATLRFHQITKRFGASAAVHDVTLEIPSGSKFSLLGPSGCGKTTLLRMTAGFERPSQGRIFIDHLDITDLPPEKRPVNTVFQNYALFPHLSVRDNIAFGLTLSPHRKSAVREEVARMLDLVDMEQHADQMPSMLSGGQKQRVGIARALAKRPAVLLMDEPLAALDLKLRQKLLRELDLIHREVGTTFVYVTHDQGEAMAISTSIAVMHKGRIQQVGTPSDIYERPAHAFVAEFIGDTNFFEGRLGAHGQPHLLEVTGLGCMHTFLETAPIATQPARLSVRPEKIRIIHGTENQPHGDNVFSGTVEDMIYLGACTRYHVRCGSHLIRTENHHLARERHEMQIQHHDPVWIVWNAGDGTLLPH